MTNRYICIHGHFYQPPRENPWLEDIEQQDSAYPFHDWNERITAECYEQNAASRILDSDEKIAQIVNNYARISFNFGPTLLSWLEQKAPQVYAALLDADRESQQRFGGHGSAMAQSYNHSIVPLANWRDKITQVVWGIRDFEYRFGRSPEGMWLAEAAVDTETLDIMAEHNIRFTLLAPRQARRVRQIGTSNWHDAEDDRIDTRQAYCCTLPSGRTINLFFYNGGVSQAVAFERLLSSGERLAQRVAGILDSQLRSPQLAHIATDGETYGHHHRFGDMALAYALDSIEQHGDATLTNYGEYLERHPPTHEVEIVENSSWSCEHGVERWRSNCGCNSGGHPGWTQDWRGPLRHALDWLRDTLTPRFEEAGRVLLRDPWQARDDYVAVLFRRTPQTVAAFLEHHATKPLSAAERSRVLKLMELQRQTMLMYTSCGWFFDEISGIETVQILRYAGRAIQLARELFDEDLEPQFLALLEHAPSNAAFNNGRDVYSQTVHPAMIDLATVGAHYAMSSLFEPYEEQQRVYCYTVEREDYQLLSAGKARLALGRINITSNLTYESERVTFGVFHLGDHNVSGGVRTFINAAQYSALVDEITDVFLRADIPRVIRLVDENFGQHSYTLKLLLGDEQRKILDIILDTNMAEAERAYRQIYDQHAPLMRFLSSVTIEVPRAFEIAAEFAINTALRRLLETEPLDLDQIQALLREARRSNVPLDSEGLSYALARTIKRMTKAFERLPEAVEPLQQLDGALGLARTLPFEVDFWQTQNVYYALLQTSYPRFHDEAHGGDNYAQLWTNTFVALGDKLRFRV